MRLFRWYLLVAACFFGSSAVAQDVKVSGTTAGSKIKVSVEPERKGLLARIAERRAMRTVYLPAQPGIIAAYPAVLPTLPTVQAVPMPVAPRPRIVIE